MVIINGENSPVMVLVRILIGGFVEGLMMEGV
jgi:hypothetical protein